ncbi:hypothetical protein MYMA111404_02895 [Mycoplasma marinum]|nr:hypothetical protein [Mycoplasma marinum]
MKFKDKKVLECIQSLGLIIKKRTLHKNGDVTLKYGKETRSLAGTQNHEAPSWFKTFEEKIDQRWNDQKNVNENIQSDLVGIKNTPTIKKELEK